MRTEAEVIICTMMTSPYFQALHVLLCLFLSVKLLPKPCPGRGILGHGIDSLGHFQASSPPADKMHSVLAFGTSFELLTCACL